MLSLLKSKESLKAITIKTSPYPGFATDLQQPLTPLLLKADGRGTIIDTIYEKRINHVPELMRMEQISQLLVVRLFIKGRLA